MGQQRSALPLAAALLACGLACLPRNARAASVVDVTLQDASGGSRNMHMVARPASVKAGKVTIHATNQSHELIHEVIVARSGGGSLPYDPKAERVIEDRIADLGEVSDLRPGASGSLTLDLKPGSYLLICNQPGHYKAGMWTRLTVTR